MTLSAIGAAPLTPATLAPATTAPARASRAPVTTEPLSRAARATDWRPVLLLVMAVSGLYVGWHLTRGWVPHDEGLLGQSAERVLLGEVPHRDFDEVYSGGLTFVNAAAFRLFGVTLLSLRLVLFAAFMAWVPAVFYIASRLVRPVAAAVVTLLCVAWSLPNYTAPIPSWYNLFLAVAGLAALFRWLEDPRRRWPVAAGVAGGVSLLVKVIGLHYVAGVLLFLVYRAHQQSRAAAAAATVDAGTVERGTGYALFVTAALAAFVAALALVVRPQPFAGEIVQFVLPGLVVSAMLVRNEWSLPAGASRARFAALGRILVPFLAGFLLPVVLFAAGYAFAGGLGALLNGVFVMPARRFGVAAHRMLSPWSMIALVPPVLVVMIGRRLGTRFSTWHAGALVLALAGFLAVTGTAPLGYRIVWYAARGLLPVLAVVAAIVLMRVPLPASDAGDAGGVSDAGDVSDAGGASEAGKEIAARRRAQLMILLGAGATFTLVQSPFAVAIYFCYVAPLVALLAVALLPHLRPLPPAIPRAFAAFLIAFAVLRMNGSELFGMGVLYRPYAPVATLELPRAALRVPETDALMYRRAVAELLAHARGGYTWAAPDAPEIYFLSGLRNPTRTFFDFFDAEPGREAAILASLERHGVTAIAVNDAPQFSRAHSPALIEELGRRYPYSRTMGKFQIRWQ